MAWTAPKVFIAGTILPASDLNTYLSANDTVLRTGGLALASQAVDDFIYASSTTQLGRVAKSTGGVPRYSGSVWAVDIGWTYATSTSIGTQNDWNPGIVGHTHIRWAGASALTVTGFAAGVAGQLLTIYNSTAFTLSLKQNNAGSGATGRMFNFCTSGDTPLGAGGMAIYQYNTTDSRWVLVHHEQGGLITPTFAAGDFTQSSGTWTVAAGDVATYAYRLSGRAMTIAFVFVTTTCATTPASLRVAIPGGMTATKSIGNPVFLLDNGAKTTGLCSTSAAAAFVSIERTDGAAFANSTDNTYIYGEITIEVT